MTSSSTEAVVGATSASAVGAAEEPVPTVVRDSEPSAVRLAELDGELRSGTWTRLGGSSVLGDQATESVLSDLAERARDAARAQGYAVGWAQGRRAGEEDARVQAERAARERAAATARQDREHAHVVAALQSAARRLEDIVAETCASVEDRAVELALQLAEAVLMREVSLAADPGADAMRRALCLVPAGEAVTVRLHPQDRAGLGQTVLTDELAGYAVRLVDDPTIARGDAVVETDTAVVDATLSSALARVREVLTS